MTWIIGIPGTIWKDYLGKFGLAVIADPMDYGFVHTNATAHGSYLREIWRCFSPGHVFGPISGFMG